jgi:S-DNA-T family DNA segregation ATPase FtsK/SpoIIIE
MNNEDTLLKQAIEIVRQFDHASISLLQRKLGIAYPQATLLMEKLEELGIVGSDDGSGKGRAVIPFQKTNPQKIETEVPLKDLKGQMCFIWVV